MRTLPIAPAGASPSLGDDPATTDGVVRKPDLPLARRDFLKGSAQPRDFGHVWFPVPDLDAAVRWLDDNPVPFRGAPRAGEDEGRRVREG